MKHFIIFLLCFSSLLSAQPTIQWQKTYGGSSYDESKSIQQTSDGGYITAGVTSSTNGDVFGQHGGFDIWMIKLSATGTIQWKKVLGGTGTDFTYTVFETQDGGFFVSGFSSSNNFDVLGNNGGDYDGWVVKLSIAGAIEWQKCLGGSDWDDFWAGKQTADHGYILAGKSKSSDGDVSGNQGNFDVWVLKINEIGTVEWTKSFGGSMEDYAKAVIQTNDGGYLVAGQTASSDGDVTKNQGNVDVWLIKLSANGTMEWQKTYGGNALDTPSKLIQSNDGNYIIAGISGSITGDVTGQHGILDFWVFKINPTGDIIWQKALGGSQPDWGRGIVAAPNGGYVVAGATHSTNGDVIGNDGGGEFWVVKLSDAGELEWQQTYGGTKADDGFAIDNCTDGGFILSGYAWSDDGDLAGSENKGYSDFCIIKLSPESVSKTQTPNLLLGHLNIYPNPASQYISIKTTDEKPMSISIMDVLGREIYHQNVKHLEPVEVGFLPKGLYLVRGLSAAGTILLGKFERI